MMIYPSKEEFIKLAKKGNLIPVYKEIYADLETPLSAFRKIDDGQSSYLLESVEGGERIGRYSILGSEPSVIIEAKGKKLVIKEKGKRKKASVVNNPIDEIESFMKQFKYVKLPQLPRFCGGLVGYMGYDIIRFIEKIPDTCKDDLKLSDIKLLLTDTIIVFDHIKHSILIVSNVHIRGNSKSAALSSYKEADEKINKIISRIHQPLEQEMSPFTEDAAIGKFKSNVNKNEFKASVKKAKDYIKKGDIIQVVLAQRFEKDYNKDPLNIYRALRSINPSPYMFYLNFGDIKLVGSSPEIMVRCEDGFARVRPIAGTRKRGKDAKEDKALEKDLLQDPKERAEHLMLVDLGRNDLGRVCEPKTVQVPEFMTIEKYSHVMHIVSDCVGVLSKDKSVYDLLKASFPAGTVSGAPKIRAMEIIDELEKDKRGSYAGCVGYFSFSGNLDTCITIRTVLLKDKKAYVQAGAGIVADSDPEKEYQETVNKAKGMLKAIAIANKIKN
ncbi:MAG: anthranilate synthase component I [Candidatus Omnitrophota bacterium]